MTQYTGNVRNWLVPGVIVRNIISMVRTPVEQADHKPGPEDLTSEWVETVMLVKQKEISVRGFARVAGKERV